MGAVARRLKKKKGLKRGLTVDRVVANPCKFFLKCVKTVSRSVESLSVDDRSSDPMACEDTPLLDNAKCEGGDVMTSSTLMPLVLVQLHSLP